MPAEDIDWLETMQVLDLKDKDIIVLKGREGIHVEQEAVNRLRDEITPVLHKMSLPNVTILVLEDMEIGVLRATDALREKRGALCNMTIHEDDTPCGAELYFQVVEGHWICPQCDTIYADHNE